MTCKSVDIKTLTVGQCFGTCAIVNVDNELLYTTDTVPYGFTGTAIDDAEEWSDRHGYMTDHGKRSLDEARREYSRTVSASMQGEPDARRILTSAHCSLAAAIQDFERNCGYKQLEYRTAECKRIREEWES